MSYYQPPALPVVGSTLHDATMAALAKRGIQEPDRDQYLAEAAVQSERTSTPLARPFAGSAAWGVSRQRDNALGALAHANLVKRHGPGYTGEQYVAEFERLALTAGHTYRPFKED